MDSLRSENGQSDSPARPLAGVTGASTGIGFELGSAKR